MKRLILGLALLIAALGGVQVASARYAGNVPPYYAYRQACHNKEYVPGFGGDWFYRYTFIVNGLRLTDPILPDTVCLPPYGGYGGARGSQ